MTSLRVIDGQTVERLLTMPACIGAMRDAMVAVSSGMVVMPPRLIAPLHDNSGFLALMPASAKAPAIYGVKTVSLHPQNSAAGRPSIQGFITLFDHETGAPIAIVEGSTVTAIRTAAASGLATGLLARDDVETHAIFGTGVQARSHVQAILAVRPDIRRTFIWGRNSTKARVLAKVMSDDLDVEVTALESAEEAAKSDVISMVTAAKAPVLKGRWLRSGVHVNLVGPHRPDEREADSDTIIRSSVYVDYMESALQEAGDIIIPIQEGSFTRDGIVGEIGDVALGALLGRTGKDQITLYKSLGVSGQDLFAAWTVYKLAEAERAGVELKL